MAEELEETVLQLSRNGLHEKLLETIKEYPNVNLNCRGISVCLS